MNSKIYIGKIYHKRLKPKEHEFTYPVYFYAIDLDELPEINKKNWLFGHNRFKVASLYDQDYLYRDSGSIREKVKQCLAKEGIQEPIARIELVTCARFFGYVFNPVSFYYCYNEQNKIIARIAEVSNTFGETHVYVLKSHRTRSRGDGLEPNDLTRPLGTASGQERSTSAKEFHVSPFFDRKGEYEFRFSELDENADIHVNLKKDGDYALVSRMWGKGVPLTAGNLLKTIIRFPLSAVMTIPRIHGQALKLYFKKKLGTFKKPPPLNEKTIRIALPKWKHKIAISIVEKFLNKLKRGQLSLVYPDGKIKQFGESIEGLNAVINVHHYDFFWRIVRDQGIGLGEGYTCQDWSSPDLTRALNLLIENKPYFESKVSFLSKIGDRINRAYHLRKSNTLKNSKKNIEDHYDLSNAMYQMFLDPSMTYSCGYYRDESEDLQKAQENKLDRILEKANIQETDHVLEIGCGWGALAIRGVQKTGCRWTGLTLSEEQLVLAKKKVREAGLEEKIDLKICDYRKEVGHYDRIVSVEMLEAVGHEYLGEFFKVCDWLLKPNGIIVIQVITIPDQRYESYKRGCDWIQKHIFPGGHLPSLSVLCDKMAGHSQLYIEGSENIGIHYARTLREWRENFLGKKDQIKALGFSEAFIRKWEYYFSYCEAGFGKRYLNDLQLVLTRVGNKNLDLKGRPKYVEFTNS